METRHTVAAVVAALEQLVLRVEAHRPTAAQDLRISPPSMVVVVVVVETVLTLAELAAQVVAALEELVAHPL